MLKKLKAKHLPLKKNKDVSSETRKGRKAKDNTLCIAVGRGTAALGTITEMSYEKTRISVLYIRFLASVIT